MEENTQSQPLETSHAIELNSMTTSTYFIQEALTSGVSIEQLKLYIKYPMRYNQQLRQLSREAFNSNGQYANVCSYMTTIPTLDFITVLNENTSINKKKQKYFKQILKKINHKLTSRDILLSLYIDGMYCAILRNTSANNKDIQLQQGFVEGLQQLEGLSIDDNMQIQPLDLDYCKFIGFQNNQQIVAFNLMYFDQFKNGGVLHEIKNFPLEFAQAYISYKKDASKQWFTLNPKTTIALKLNANIKEPYGRPLGLSAIYDIRFAEDYYTSQINTVSDLASSIYILTLPDGEKKGSCSLDKTQQLNLVSAFEGAVSVNTSNNQGKSKISKVTLAPGAKIERLTKDASLLKDTLSTENINKIATSLGFAGASLNAQGDGGASYSTLAVNINLVLTQIFAIVEQIAYEYTRVLNSLTNSKGNEIIDIKYLRTSILNQTENYNRAKELYTLCGGTISHVVAEAGYDMDDYVAVKQMESDENYSILFAPNMTAFTNNGSGDNQGGRPEDETSKNDNTIKSKSNGTNKTPKPSNK